jgi:hypothetical protein
MNSPARLLLVVVILAARAATSWGQVNIEPTPPPIVSAENETWFQAGDPLAFAGGLYDPAGAAMHFLPNEMVPSGFYRGIPLYTRTTIEPYSRVFVPITGGMVQPYERRRMGELVRSQGRFVMPQAAAPPVVGTAVIADESFAPLPPTATPAEAAAEPAATSGRVPPARAPRPRPGSANGIYVEFGNARWFAVGSPIPTDAARLTRIGDIDGFAVYAPQPGASTIYVQIAQGVETFAPYSRRSRSGRR